MALFKAAATIIEIRIEYFIAAVADNEKIKRLPVL
jgi:hypothetical protein